MSKDTIVTYANGRAESPMQGRTSQKLRLATVVAGTQLASWKNVVWAPSDGGVHDLEVAARITNVDGTLGAVVKVLWYAELGAADVEYREPAPAPPNGAGVPIVPWWMPDRGMRLRVNAKGVKLGFRAVIVSGAAVSLEVTASIQPTSTGPDTARFPVMTSALTNERVAVPMGANEWRFRDPTTGLPFGAGAVVGIGVVGALIGPLALASMGDFLPISPFIHSYQAGAAHIVEFR